MRAWLGCTLALLSGLGCAEDPVELPLRSLERSGTSAFVCIGPDADGVLTGKPADACQAGQSAGNRMLALVTQTLRGEVAVVDLTREEVIDTNPAVPGFSFLPVGANPVDIAALPDGRASIVAVGEIGKAGLFVLPTVEVEHPHDLTGWPACSLPSAPSAITVLNGTDSCAGNKLAVAMPDLGEVWIVDAEDLLARPRGSFDACAKSVVSLQSQASGALPNQLLPSDLQTPATCGEPVPPTMPAGGAARPADLALAPARLYVADQGVSLVHVLDVSDPCAVVEQEPLLPRSYEAPFRDVFTRRVAVSPETVAGERFVYAIDDREGTVMVFDVSAGSTNRTPLVRSGTPRMPFEPADRISFNSPVRDVEFITHDVPKADPNTGIAVSGTLCDPDPSLPDGDPAVEVRTSSNRETGAGPRILRGIFAMVALASGQVVVVDVEDWDAACRRPAETNPGAEPDFRGCSGDPDIVAYRTPSDLVTVSDEATCAVVQPHRARSANYLVTSNTTGVRAPSLRFAPRLTSEQGIRPSDQTQEGRRHPKLLAVPFPPPWPRTPDPSDGARSTNLCGDLWIGTTRQRAFCDDAGTPLSTGNLAFDPALADNGSLLLSQVQPRAHVTEDVSATYEGRILAERDVGIPMFEDNDVPRFLLRDNDAGFCSGGVQDVAAAGLASADLPLQSGVSAETFGRHHADYVQITGDFPAEDDGYWSAVSPEICPGAVDNRRSQCESVFGSVETPGTTRDFRILEARQGRLLLEPRNPSALPWADLKRDLQCCFPSSLSYVVRGGHQWIVAGSVSGFRHDQFPDPAAPPGGNPQTIQGQLDSDRGCMRAPECNPRRVLLKSRVFEVSSSTTCTEAMTTADSSVCPVGTPTGEGDDLGLACQFAFAPDSQWLRPSDPAQASCVFESITTRFAIYRGAEPSERDFAFVWQSVGGFVPLFTELATLQSSAVLPQSLTFVPQLGQLAVADGATQGLVLIDLDTVGLEALYF